MNTKIRKIIYVAVCASLFILLGKFVTIDLGNLKITLKSLPIYVGAITLGPIEGALIGFIGELALQLTGQYGFTATTLFWVLPYVIIGAICGIAFENKIIKFNGGIKYGIFIVSLQVLLSILNTIVYFIDSIIFGYYSFILIFGSLVGKLMLSILTGILYSVILPFIVNAIKKIH